MKSFPIFALFIGKGFVSLFLYKTLEPMKNYEFTLYCKHDKTCLIDSTLIENCTDRDEALMRVKRLMMYQGLYLSSYHFTLKKTNKVKEYSC